MKKTVFAIIFLILLSFVTAEEQLYPTTISELTTHVTFGGSGSIENLKNGEEVNFQTLTFQENPYQTTQAIQEQLIINNKIINPSYTLDEYGNKFVNFKIQENGTFTYTISAQILTKSLIYNINDYNLNDYNNTLDLYTQKSEKIESDSTEILTLSKNKLYKDSYIETVNDAVFWTNDYVEYATGSDFQKYYLLQRSAIETLIDKKGVCDEFANLAAGILRAKKIPTIINIGITYDGTKWGNHAWIGTYHKDFGWIPSDPTFRESGFVDATHIKLANFLDESESNAKATYPSTAKVIINNPNDPIVTILAKKYFNEVTLSSNSAELNTKQWNDFPITIKNTTGGTITAPISIKQNYKDIFVDEKTKAVILKPNEQKVIVFRIYPDLNLNRNEVASGELTLNSLTQPHNTQLKINPAKNMDNGETTVKDITPIATIDNIGVQIKITNYSSNTRSVDINISDANNSYDLTEKILPFSTKNIDKDVPLNEEGYTVTITTPTEIVTQKIYLEKQKITILPNVTKTNTVIQQINLPSTTELSEKLKNNPEIIIIALLMGVVTILLGIFIVKKQYV